MKFSKVIYLAFCTPFILAYISWRFFPVFAHAFITHAFGYEVDKPVNRLWHGVAQFFYGWYTFLAVGVAGFWALAATFARIKRNKAKLLYYPMRAR